MNKKNYQKPAMQVVNINTSHKLLELGSGPKASKAAGNAGFNENISAGNGDARSRSFDDWGDEE